MGKHKLRIGIVGTGSMASLHEAGYTEIDDLCELVAFCDTNEEVARTHAEHYQARVYTAYQDLLANQEIDIVDIIAPYHLHYPIALAALEAGKHVLVEKPMAMTSVQALELIETAKRMEVYFTVAENAHFVAAYQETREFLQTEKLGEVRLVRSYRAGNETEQVKNESSEGEQDENRCLLLSAEVQTFYLLQWLLGKITDIQAIAYKLLPESEVEDHILAVGHLDNGAVFSSTQSCILEMPWTERLEIHGSLGSLIVEQLARPAIYFHSTEDSAGPPLDTVPYEPLAWRYLSIVAEVQDFVQAVLEKRAPRVDPLDSYHALQTVEAAHRSMEEAEFITLQKTTQ
jgi:UDP-N-acetyl-2-amino-2-deoxyglucuronate dehydrogenase